MLCASVAHSRLAEALRQEQEVHAAQVKDAWDKQVFHAVKVPLKVKGSTEPSPGCRACRIRPGKLYRQGRGCQGKRVNEARGSRGKGTHGE